MGRRLGAGRAGGPLESGRVCSGQLAEAEVLVPSSPFQTSKLAPAAGGLCGPAALQLRSGGICTFSL